MKAVAGDAAARVLLPPQAPLHGAVRGAVLHRLHGTSMGTVWRLVLAADPGADLAALQRAIDARLTDLVAQMSHWDSRSQLSQFNHLPAGAWATLPVDFAAVMRCALGLAAQSSGAFDPALGAAVDAWGFGARQRYDEEGFVPPPAGPQPGPAWRGLVMDGDRLQQPGGCRLDLSAIAKGYGVDAVAALLRAHGHRSFLFELGGELAGAGLKPDGHPWWVGVERPPGAHGLPALRVGLVGHALATSGDYRQGFTDPSGRWCSHTLDPRTGAPCRHGLASVSVLHERCMQADALATALFVLGPDQGLAWATAHGVAAWFVERVAGGAWREWPSPALRPWLDD